MATTYNLGCAPLWVDWMQGVLLAGGTLTFYNAGDHSVLQNVYQDPFGMTPWANPLTLDAYGRSTLPIYFANNSSLANPNYFIVVKNSNGATDYTIDNYNGALTAIPAQDTSNQNVNIVRNGQFTVWDHQPVQLSSVNGNVLVTTNASVGYQQICDDWYIIKSNNNATDKVSRVAFTSGQTNVPYSPSFYLQYQCTANTGGETFKYIAQKYYQTSEFLNGQMVSFSFWAKADQARGLTVSWGQNFGTGGSPSSTVITPMQTFALNTTWTLYTISGFTIPSTSGKQQGTTEFTSFTSLLFSLDTNVTCTYDFCNVQLELGSAPTDFKAMSYEQYRALTANEFREQTGHVEFVGAQTLNLWDAGYIPLNDSTIGNPSSGAGYTDLSCYNLFCVLWVGFANTQCPLLDSGGTPTARGANAVADWNANRRLTLPLSMGRLFGNYGAGSGLSSRVAGQTGGNQSALVQHSHTFTNNGGLGATAAVPVNAAFNTFGAAAATLGGGNKFIETGNGGADGIVNLTNTDNTAATPTDGTMNPFVFWPAWIHK